MADPVSLLGSIIAILQLTTSVYKYVNDVKGAPSEVSRLRDSIDSASSPLHLLRDRLEERSQDPTWLSSINLLDGADGPLNQFRNLLEQVAFILATRDGKWNGIDKVRKSLAWPFKKGEVQALLDAMERQKSLFHLALQNDALSLAQAIKRDTSLLPDLAENVVEIRKQVESLYVNEVESRNRAIINWLSPINFFPTQDDFLRRREEGTGQWFLESDRFKDWFDGVGGTLRCSGIPGSGKTILTSIAADHIYKHFKGQSESKIGLAYAYCNYKEREAQSPVNLFASFWMQLIQRKVAISDNVQALYEKHVPKGTRPNLGVVSKILKEETDRFEKIYLLVDALDECADNDIEVLIRHLKDLQPKVILMVTSRPSNVIADLLEGASLLDISANSSDLLAYVTGRINGATRLMWHVRSDATLAEDIKKGVVEAADNMFLLAKLHMDSLVSKPTQRSVRQALDTLPKDLDDTYEDAMLRIEQQNDDDRRLANQVICWISFAVRPLWVSELRTALAIEPGMGRIDDADLPQEEILTSVCAGLVVIDRESQVVRLCHYSTEEYLKRVRQEKFPNASTDIARTCLTCLLFDEYRKDAVSSYSQIRQRIQEHNFYDYAAANWGKHTRGAPEKDLLDLVLDLLTSEESLVSSVRSQNISDPWGGISWDNPMSGLHLAAVFGLDYIADTLLSQGVEIDAKDGAGESALHKAAREGNEATVRLLLHHGAEANAKDNRGFTAIHMAFRNRHEVIVRILLRQGTEVNAEDVFGMTALHMARINGNNDIMIWLLEKVEAMFVVEVKGRTALHLASELGDEEIVKTLLNHGVDVHTGLMGYQMGYYMVDRYTPLHSAAKEGHLALVRLLVERGAKVESLSTLERTPLHEAVFGGHAPIVNMLLELGVSVHRKDYRGWTALHVAANRSSVQMAKILLDHGADVEALSSPYYRNTVPYPRPLSDASRTSLPRPFPGDRTPLHHAAAAGDLETFDLLRENGASIQSRDTDGMMPIHMAAMGGSLQILERILDTGFEVDTRDTVEGHTALHWAVNSGKEDCIALFLRRGADVEAQNNRGRSARHMASLPWLSTNTKSMLDQDWRLKQPIGRDDGPT